MVNFVRENHRGCELLIWCFIYHRVVFFWSLTSTVILNHRCIKKEKHTESEKEQITSAFIFRVTYCFLLMAMITIADAQIVSLCSPIRDTII